MPDLVGIARDKRAERIRALNDEFRSTFIGGQVVKTASIAVLPPDVREAAILATQRFDVFDKTNDPYGEHDFGAFEMGELTFFWKIDYYDKKMTGGSEDRSDPEQTIRVLTLMLSTDY